MVECAILAVAAATSTVHALLQKLVKDVVLDAQTTAVPWTITNKYYTAEVNFLVYPLSSWSALQDVLSAPALLFVWHRGEPYREHIHKLALLASQREFDVVLAVRLPSTSPILPAEVEDEQDIDAHLSSKGFEFVDVPDVEPRVPDRTGILGVPRIVDALSTIMWPSMIRQSSKQAATTAMHKKLSSDDYHNLVKLVGERISGNGGDHIHQELEELERWLDEDTRSADGGEDDGIPWSTAVTPGTLSPSLSGFLPGSRPDTPEAGFDDDFTYFVSAASETDSGIAPTSLDNLSSRPPSFSSTFNFHSASSGRSTPFLDDAPSFDTSRLAPREAYTSLGSVSDLGDPDKEPVHIEQSFASSNEEDEQDMPTRVEIMQTSHAILGTASSPLSPSEGGALGGEPPQVDVEMTDADLERFDLQNVLSVLQGLKEEIAGLPDRERRKAAARVALGLAYGFGGDLHT